MYIGQQRDVFNIYIEENSHLIKNLIVKSSNSHMQISYAIYRIAILYTRLYIIYFPIISLRKRLNEKCYNDDMVPGNKIKSS